MFCDSALITVNAGNGGNGCISFHKEKYVPKGPPDGGDGGWGGSVIFRVNRNLNTLTNFRSQKFFKAESGKNGSKCNRTGHDGANLILDVPEGSQIYDPVTNELLIDLTSHNEQYIAARGGKGGLGNARFVNSVNQAPRIAEKGEPGEVKELQLELKLVADVGLIGMPNAGKSTLISVISNARPKIADYPFTTIVPNLGVTKISDQELVFCDIPGIIEGAHEGKGLGDLFLKHVERTKLLIHILDCNSPAPFEDYQKLNHELNNFSKNLAKKPQIVALSKIDLIDEECLKMLQQESKNFKIKKLYAFSAVSKDGINELLYEALKQITSLNKKTARKLPKFNPKIKIFKPRPDAKSTMGNFDINRQKNKVSITGQRIEQLIKMTDFMQPDAERRVYNILKKTGMLKALHKEGLIPGDKFYIGEKELEYRE